MVKVFLFILAFTPLTTPLLIQLHRDLLIDTNVVIEGELRTSGNIYENNELCCTRQITCGNSVVEAWESCDDGATVDGDGCNSKCQTEYCGDGVTQGALGEECDDANSESGDGCHLCHQYTCGNGRIDPGEECDDGNALDGDLCSAVCAYSVLVEVGPARTFTHPCDAIYAYFAMLEGMALTWSVSFPVDPGIYDFTLGCFIYNPGAGVIELYSSMLDKTGVTFRQSIAPACDTTWEQRCFLFVILSPVVSIHDVTLDVGAASLYPAGVSYRFALGEHYLYNVDIKGMYLGVYCGYGSIATVYDADFTDIKDGGVGIHIHAASVFTYPGPVTFACLTSRQCTGIRGITGLIYHGITSGTGMKYLTQLDTNAVLHGLAPTRTLTCTDCDKLLILTYMAQAMEYATATCTNCDCVVYLESHSHAYFGDGIVGNTITSSCYYTWGNSMIRSAGMVCDGDAAATSIAAYYGSVVMAYGTNTLTGTFTYCYDIIHDSFIYVQGATCIGGCGLCCRRSPSGGTCTPGNLYVLEVRKNLVHWNYF